MNPDMTNLHLPAEAFYTRNHEWLTIDENVITLGMTSHTTEKIGEILYVDLPEVGDKISLGSPFAEIESAKHVIDLVGCFIGTVLEINQRLLEDPSIINDDPYGDGWILIAELDNERDLAGLLRQDEYKKFLVSDAVASRT